MEILAYLYDADGSDKEIKLESGILESLNDNQLLWINVLKRDREIIESVASALNLKKYSDKEYSECFRAPEN